MNSLSLNATNMINKLTKIKVNRKAFILPTVQKQSKTKRLDKIRNLTTIHLTDDTSFQFKLAVNMDSMYLN